MLDSTDMKYFQNLGAMVERLWKEARYDERAFSEIATQVLHDQPPNERVSFWDAVKYGVLSDDLPNQVDLGAEFGQPPLTVYWSHGFRIELLFWVVGLTDIHQHAFSGAFHVMHGSSLHTVQEFEIEERVVTRLLYGKLGLKKAELLRTGDIRSIEAGNKFIHATFHLDRPSVTVVIRTNREVEHLPQYSYLPPSIAFSDDQLDPVIKRRIQLLRMLGNAGRFDELYNVIIHLLERADTYSAFQCLLDTFPMFANETDRNRLLLAASRKHSRLIEVCHPALIAQDRRIRITNLRNQVANPDLQFFLALLLNVSGRDSILELVKDRYQCSDPAAKVIGWVNELSRLGLTDTKFPEAWLVILRSLLHRSDVSQVQRELAELHGKKAIAGITKEIELLAEALREYWLLCPLFEDVISC
jgi:hypothetical protein